MCRARLSYTLVKGLPRIALWPVAVAALVRVAAWALISGARFASDEQGYVDAGIALAATGQQDLFWPPLTGWIVAAVKTIAPSAPLSAIRLIWIAMDLANVALVAVLAERIGRRRATGAVRLRPVSAGDLARAVCDLRDAVAAARAVGAGGRDLAALDRRRRTSAREQSLAPSSWCGPTCCRCS